MLGLKQASSPAEIATLLNNQLEREQNEKISEQKRKHLENLVDDQGIIGALAIDQRGALKRMMGKYKEVTAQEISDFKVLVSRCLTPETSAILLIQNMA